MARWQPEKHDILSELAGEITHNYPRGGVLVAVDGGRTDGTVAFADDLAAVLRESRPDVVRVGIDEMRSVDRGALVVADGEFLGRDEVKGSWHFLVWVDEPHTPSARRADARTIANAMVDNGDAEHPRRVFADSC